MEVDIIENVLQVESDRVFQTRLKTYSRYGIHPTTRAEYDEIKDDVMFTVLKRLTTYN